MAKGFLSSLFIGFEHFDQCIAEFLGRNVRPELCGGEIWIVITPVGSVKIYVQNCLQTPVE